MRKNEEHDLARMDNSSHGVSTVPATASETNPMPSSARALYRITLSASPRLTCFDVPIIEHAADEIARLTNVSADLLAALKDVMEVLRVEAPGTPLNHHKYDALGIRAHAAIAKAERQ